MSLRNLPSVDQLISSGAGDALIERYGRQLTLSAIRNSLDTARDRIRSGGNAPQIEELLQDIDRRLSELLGPTLRPVINATGVLLHTNLGRAPLSHSARQEALRVSSGYSSLEFDLASGQRGSRHDHVESLLKQATGAEAALVVNNNAGAVLLALTAIASGKEAIISRSQLVEIGGGFRIPDVMKQSGARLVEVGTTNRTHLRDYEEAISPDSGILVRAHHSNFRLVGFTTEPSLADLAGLSRVHKIPLLDDLGSGALLDTADFGLNHEPMVQESLQSGASLVAFSGDKLLGGPQAGILVGEKALLDPLKGHPLARALRPDKLCLAALAATVRHYLRGEAVEMIPLWRMIAAEPDSLRLRAETWQSKLGLGQLRGGESTVGGGSLPGGVLPTWQLAIDHPHPDAAAQGLRRAATPVICRIVEGQLVLDPRTVLESQDEDLLDALQAAIRREHLTA